MLSGEVNDPTAPSMGLEIATGHLQQTTVITKINWVTKRTTCGSK